MNINNKTWNKKRKRKNSPFRNGLCLHYPEFFGMA